MPQVTCVGLLTADVVGKPIDRLPERGRLALVERMELHTGGCAANTGAALARLGVDTAIIGKVGNDGFGDFIVRRLAEQGADTRGVVHDAVTATSATMVMVHSDGERSFVHYYGTNATLSLADVDMDLALASPILHVAGTLLMPAMDGEPVAQLLSRAKEAGITTALDTAWDTSGQWMELVGLSLPYVDYFLPSMEEARMLADGIESVESIADCFLERGVGVVALKMGEAGCFVASRDGTRFRVPAMQVTAVDALGAGDAFVAGFLLGLVQKRDLMTCARLGNVVGGCCVSALGATTGVRDFDTTMQMLEQFSANLERNGDH
jgi:sugar/nucleoside kinase (ribokinase family)